MSSLPFDPPTLQRTERDVCLLFGAEIHNAEGGFVDDDAIVKPGPEVSLCGRSKGLKSVAESRMINGLVGKEVVTESGVCEIVDRQPRRPEQGILVRRPDKSVECRTATTEIVAFPRVRSESTVHKFTAVREFGMAMGSNGRAATSLAGVGDLLLWVLGCSFFISAVDPVGITQPDVRTTPTTEASLREGAYPKFNSVRRSIRLTGEPQS